MAGMKAPFIFGKITKLLFSLFIFGVCAILIWRVFFSTKVPESVELLDVNPTLVEACEVNGGELTFQYQNLSTITRAKDSYGYFSVVSCVFIPEADQVQLVFRYNNSTIRHLQEDYGLAELPEKSQHLYDVSLTVATDLTPDTHDDDLNEAQISTQRILPSAQPVREETALYTYYRYVFDGVQLEEDTNSVYVDVYYAEDIRYDQRPYSTLLIYAWDEAWISYEPSRADLRKLCGED